MEAEADANTQTVTDLQETHSAELTRCKLEIASITGQLVSGYCVYLH